MNVLHYGVNFILLFASYLVLGAFLYTVLAKRYGIRQVAARYLPFAAALAALNMLMEAMVETLWITIPWITLLYSVCEFVATVLIWKRLSGSRWAHVLLAYLAGVVFAAVGSAAGRALSMLLMQLLNPEGLLVRVSSNYMQLSVFTTQCALYLGAARAYRRIFQKKIGDVRITAFSLVLISQLIGLLILSAFIFFGGDAGLPIRLVNLAYACICAFADWFLFKTFRDVVKSAELEESMRSLHRQQMMQQEAYRNLSEQILQLRRMRHDYINTLETIGSLLHNGDVARAETFSGDLCAAMRERGVAVYTGNQIVDAVLTNKRETASERGIAFRVEMLWPNEPMAADADLMSLFANLLDNAIAYCDALPDSMERQIGVSTRMQGSMLLVDVYNTYPADTPPPLAEATDAKGNAEHGYGLGIVKSIAERSGGALIASCRDGMLHMSVLLGGAGIAGEESAAKIATRV